MASRVRKSCALAGLPRPGPALRAAGWRRSLGIVGVFCIFLLNFLLSDARPAWAAPETISCNTGGSRTLTVGTFTDSDGSEFSSGADLTLNVGTGSNCTFTITQGQADSAISLASLTIASGVTMTHDVAGTTAGTHNQLFFSIAGTLDVQSGGAIDVNEKGYLGAQQGANASNTGRTNGNTTTGGSETLTGGSHGGRGGLYTSLTIADSYGDIKDPILPGGGGGGISTGGQEGENGGGVIRITAATITVNGSITANGGSTNTRGGGAGGSINLNSGTGTLSGTGSITANGGGGGNPTAGGAGGRIALLFGTDSFSGTLSTYGGVGISTSSESRDGSAGTIYKKDGGDANGHITVDNNNLTDAHNPTSIDADNDATFDSVTILNRGRLWLESDGTSFSTTKLEVQSNSLFESDVDLSFSVVDTSNLYVNGGTAQFDGALTVTDFATTGSVTGTLITSGTATVSSGAPSIGTGLDWELLGTAEKSSGVNLDSVDVTGTLTLGATTLGVDDVTVNSGGVITHKQFTTTAAFTPSVDLTISGGLVVNSGGAIDVEGKGYLGGYNSSESFYADGILNTDTNSSNTGRTNGNTTTGGSETLTGGSHGGRGGLYTSLTIADSYGDIKDPILPGGGGGGISTGGQEGENGGGVIRITAATITVNGSITANGGSTNTRGGGAGGSINLNASGTLSGSGSITANGGGGGNPTAGGGGGRISWLFSTDSFTGTLSAYGGVGISTSSESRDGSAGTIFKKATTDTNGHVTVDNNNLTDADKPTSIDADNDTTFDTTTITNRGRLWIESDGTAFVPGVLEVQTNTLFESDIDLSFASLSTSTLNINGGIAQFDGALTLTNLSTTGTITGILITSGTATISSGTPSIGTGLTWELLGTAQKSTGVNLDSVTVTGTLTMGDTSLSVTNDVTVNSGGTITHKTYGTTVSFTPRVELSIGGDLIVNSGGSLNENANGYLGGRSSAEDFYADGILNAGETNNDNSGRTDGNVDSGSGSLDGGSHGGRGGLYTTVPAAYDAITNPTLPGGGGGGITTAGQLGENGGGMVRITATNMTVNGNITADGGSTNTRGGGAGGSIFLNASGTISGTGSITANGGGGGNPTTGGGGGRIAILFGTFSHTGSVSAVGGEGSGSNRDGAAGTVWKKAAADTFGDLTISNCSACSQANFTTSMLTTVPTDDQVADYNNGYFFKSVAVSQNGILNIPSAIDSVSNGGTNASRQFFSKSCPDDANGTDNDTASDGEIVHDTELVASGMTADYVCVGTRKIQFTLTSSNGSESTTAVNLELTLSSTATSNVTVNYAVMGGTATGGGTDYTLVAGVATVTAGNTTTNIPVAINNDSTDEDDETIIVGVSTPSSNAELGTNTSHTYTINDDDAPPTVTLAIVGTPLAENGGVATVTANLSAQSGKNITVGLAFAGTATLTDDYTRSGTSIAINAGSTSGNISITGVNDSTDEDDQTVIVDLDTCSNCTESGTQQVTATITDDDASPTATLTIVGTPLVENGGVATVTANISAQSERTVTVNIAFSGTATLTTDYTRSATSIAISAGNTSNTLDITSVTDTLDENNETVIMDLDTCTNCTESGTQQVTATITDDDLPPTATMTVDITDIAENAGSATVTVTLSAASGLGNWVGIDFYGTASGSDYTEDSDDYLYITAGDTTASFTITGVDDSIDDDDETVIVDLWYCSNCTESGTQQVTVTITDDDTADVTVDESGGSTNTTEGGTTDTYTLVLTSEPLGDVVISITTDADTTVVPAVVTFTDLDWYTPQTITVTAVDDDVAEGNHSGTVTHTVTSNVDTLYDGIAVPDLTANIVDNDSAGVSVAQSGNSTDVTEGDTTDSYTIVLTSEPTGDVLIAINSDDAEYGVTTSPSQLTFTAADWNTPQAVTVTAVDDKRDEGIHAPILSHVAQSSDANYDGLGISDVNTTVTDNDSAGVSISESDNNTVVTESGNTDTYTVVLTSEPTATVTVTVATDGKLSAEPTTLKFTAASWNVAQTVTLSTTNDSVVEGDSASTVTHSVSSTDANYSGIEMSRVTVTITDDGTAIDDGTDVEEEIALNAEVGVERSMVAGKTLLLGADGSMGSEWSYQWELLDSGEFMSDTGEVFLSDETTSRAVLTVADTYLGGDVTVRLTVTDVDGTTVTDTVTIHVAKKTSGDNVGQILDELMVGTVGEWGVYEGLRFDSATKQFYKTLQVANATILLPSDQARYSFRETPDGRLMLNVESKLYISREVATIDGVTRTTDTNTFDEIVKEDGSNRWGTYMETADLTNDGAYEYVVTAPDVTSGYGAAYVYDTNYQLVARISGSSEYRIRSVLNVGNFLGSGTENICFGPDNTAMNQNLEMDATLNATADSIFCLNGGSDFGSRDLGATGVDTELGYDASGATYQFAASGDLNNDGLDDLAISSDDGRILVYFGSEELGLDLKADEADVRIIKGSDTTEQDYCFGRSMAIGDVTGDGNADLIAGEACGSGKIYVIFGSEEWEREIDVGSAPNVQRIEGPPNIGGDIMLAGDTDGGYEVIYTGTDDDEVYEIDLVDELFAPTSYSIFGGACSLNHDATKSSRGLFLILIMIVGVLGVRLLRSSLKA